jgi:hypothetical protein
MKRIQVKVLLHGLVIILVGFLCGVPYGRAITRGWGEAAVRGWGVAHVSLVIGGLWLMMVAAVSDLLVLGPRGSKVLLYSVVTSGYGFMLALVVGASSGVRGLEATGSAVNLLVFATNTVASVAALVWVGVTITGALRALRQKEKG